MSSFANVGRRQGEQFGGGMAGAVVLHVAVAGALIAAALVHHSSSKNWGEQVSTAGAIQASMVNALPLPPKAEPVKNQVLAADDTNPAPKPPPKEETAPPPKPTDVLVKAPTPKQPVKTAPTATPEPPKHPQPTPPTPKADTGSSATQLPQSIAQLRNGTSIITVEDRTFGVRYAYYMRAMERAIAEQYDQQDVDSRSSQGKTVLLSFEIEHDGSMQNIQIVDRSGSASLDTAALRSLQRIDSFGPLPAGDHVPMRWAFSYHLQ